MCADGSTLTRDSSSRAAATASASSRSAAASAAAGTAAHSALRAASHATWLAAKRLRRPPRPSPYWDLRKEAVHSVDGALASQHPKP